MSIWRDIEIFKITKKREEGESPLHINNTRAMATIKKHIYIYEYEKPYFKKYSANKFLAWNIASQSIEKVEYRKSDNLIFIYPDKNQQDAPTDRPFEADLVVLEEKRVAFLTNIRVQTPATTELQIHIDTNVFPNVEFVSVREMYKDYDNNIRVHPSTRYEFLRLMSVDESTISDKLKEFSREYLIEMYDKLKDTEEKVYLPLEDDILNQSKSAYKPIVYAPGTSGRSIIIEANFYLRSFRASRYTQHALNSSIVFSNIDENTAPRVLTYNRYEIPKENRLCPTNETELSREIIVTEETKMLPKQTFDEYLESVEAFDSLPKSSRSGWGGKDDLGSFSPAAPSRDFNRRTAIRREYSTRYHASDVSKPVPTLARTETEVIFTKYEYLDNPDNYIVIKRTAKKGVLRYDLEVYENHLDRSTLLEYVKKNMR